MQIMHILKFFVYFIKEIDCCDTENSYNTIESV